jgi:hypothetical protein
MSAASDIVDRALFMLTPPLRENVRLQIEAAINSETARLREIEAAAKEWRASMENDGWCKEDIESGICRPGIAKLMRLIVENAMSDLFTIDALERYLRDEVIRAGGAKKWCRKHKVFMDHALHMIDNGSAAGLPRIQEALGFKKVTMYERQP